MAVVRIPFTYTVAGVLRRHRSHEPWIFGGWAEAEIPEVSEREAPASMTWMPDSDVRRGQNPERHVARWHGGRNYIDLGRRSPAPFLLSDFERLRDLERERIRGQGGLHSHLLADATGQDFWDLSGFLSGSIPEEEGGEFREVLHHGRAEAEAAVLRRCRDLLFVDGKLWRAGAEPMYSVRVDPRVHGPATPIMAIAGPGHNDSVTATVLFRADRPDDTADFCREMAGEAMEDVRFDRIEVLIPEAVTFDDEAWTQRAAARQALDASKPMLAEAPVPSLMAWAALRDALARDDPPEELHGLLEGLAAAFPLSARVTRIAGIAARRWELRPVELPGLSP